MGKRGAQRKHAVLPLSIRLPLEIETELRRRCSAGARDGQGWRNRTLRSGIVVAMKEALRRYYWILEGELRANDLAAEEIDVVAAVILKKRKLELSMVSTLVRGVSPSIGEKLDKMPRGRLAALVDAIQRVGV